MTILPWSKPYNLHIPLACTLLLIVYLTPCYATSISFPPDNILMTNHQSDKFYHFQSNNEKKFNNELKDYPVAAQRGKSDVLRYLKNIYYNDKSKVQNYSKAEFWYWHEKASRQGDAESQFNLGYMYLHGLGVSYDYTKVRFWFERSSNQSDPIAKYFLGLIYYEGKGVKKNHKKAQILFQQSCSDGLSPACYCLKIMTE